MTLLDTYRKWRGKRLKPGQRCPISGVYTETLNNADEGVMPRQATCVRGEPMPPTTKGGRWWTIVDAANVNEADG